MIAFFSQYLRTIPMAMIRVYQKTFSLDHGIFKFLYPNGYCKFYPTCSEYGYQAFEQHGLFKGFWLTVQRVLRCNPWSQSGLDPVPEPIKKAV